MRKLVVFIATSFDGYIATSDGGIDWLFTDADYGYSAFYDRIDAVLMGRRTFDQILTFGDYPYVGKENYVFTSEPSGLSHEHAPFVSGDVGGFLRSLREKPGRDIWLVGGARLIEQFVEQGLVDEWIISVHPILLGSGVRLFSGLFSLIPLDLQSVQQYASGLVQLHYLKRGPVPDSVS